MDRPATTFGSMLTAQWVKHGLHQAAFCRAIAAPAGWVQQIREGKKTPPIGRMDEWANVLRLVGAERALFHDLAAIAHLPVSSRPRFTAFAISAYLAALNGSRK